MKSHRVDNLILVLLKVGSKVKKNPKKMLYAPLRSCLTTLYCVISSIYENQLNGFFIFQARADEIATLRQEARSANLARWRKVDMI